MKDFKGRVAVVTGAASGIGLGVVERFLAEGMNSSARSPVCRTPEVRSSVWSATYAIPIP